MTDDKLFEIAFSYIMQFEGESYTNDPIDPGGETKYGISKRSFPDINIKNLTREQAKKIYYQNFWIPSMANKIIDDEFSVKYFDICVNMGIRRAGVIVQKLVNLFSSSSIPEDGVMGSKTLHSLNELLSGKRKQVALLALAGFQFDRYLELMTARPVMKKYAAGWTVRAMRIPRSTDRLIS